MDGINDNEALELFQRQPCVERFADIFRSGLFHQTTVDFYGNHCRFRLPLATITARDDHLVMLDERFERSPLLEFKKGWVGKGRWLSANRNLRFRPCFNDLHVQVIHSELTSGLQFIAFNALDERGQLMLVVIYRQGWIPTSEDEKRIDWLPGLSPLLGGNGVSC